MHEQFLRTQMLLGTEALERLQAARVAVFGIGGVGGYTVEALARSGIGQLDLIDSDCVSISNINRQILATHSTVGLPKVEAARRRILDINPGCMVRTHEVFYTPETAGQFDFTQYDYIVDAIDTVTGKLAAEGHHQVVLGCLCSCIHSHGSIRSALLYATDCHYPTPSVFTHRRHASLDESQGGAYIGVHLKIELIKCNVLPFVAHLHRSIENEHIYCYIVLLRPSFEILTDCR